MHTYYLLDNHYILDKARNYATFGHLLAYNPGAKDVEISLTIYNEERDTQSLKLPVKAGRTNESNWVGWKIIAPGQRFAYKVESPEPLACQVTYDWNNIGNAWPASDQLPKGGGECAGSYMAIRSLSTDWYCCDCIILTDPKKFWAQESEWLIVLNPGDQGASVTADAVFTASGEKNSHQFNLGPRRVKWILMDEHVKSHHALYGLHVHSSTEIAAQQIRTVKTYASDALMSFWSTPLVPGPL